MAVLRAACRYVVEASHQKNGVERNLRRRFGMPSTDDRNNLSWSSGSPPNQIDAGSSAICAYQRARAAYRHLEEITKRVDERQLWVQSGEKTDAWSAQVAEYLALRREWNTAFQEFDRAVNEYAAALWEERLSACAEWSAPRKPR
jgi:hypothetical protein